MKEYIRSLEVLAHGTNPKTGKEFEIARIHVFKNMTIQDGVNNLRETLVDAKYYEPIKISLLISTTEILRLKNKDFDLSLFKE